MGTHGAWTGFGPRFLWIVSVVVALGCGSGEKTTSSASMDASSGPGAAVPVTTQQAAPPTTSSPAVTAPASILIDEVLYRPAGESAPFVELANVGLEPVDLARVNLMLDEQLVPLAAAAKTLAPGGRLLVVLDGPVRAEGAVYHTGEATRISADAGRAALIDEYGKPIDEVSWGPRSGAVNPVQGGARFEMESGSSIGRPPGAHELRNPRSWIGYAPSQVTPGAPNPPAAVKILHPMSGTSTARAGAALSWFPVPGATGYRVQVATEKSFAKPVLETSLSKPGVDVSELSPGRYLWRVQSQYPGDAVATYSATSVLTLLDASTGGASASHRNDRPFHASVLPSAITRLVNGLLAQASPPQPTRSDTGCDRTSGYQPLSTTTCVLLRVPLITQHKDTEMLLLEHPIPSGSHAWDADHQFFDPADDSDTANCGLASLAMMNHHAGGDLSQDRIGYEILKDRPGMPGRPEGDLMYGDGLGDDPEMPDAYEFALGTRPTPYRFTGGSSFEFVTRIWNEARAQIEKNRPLLVLSTTANHYFVVVGYQTIDERKILIVNDPWPGRRNTFELSNPDDYGFIENWIVYVPPGDFNARMQEPGVIKDSDGDRVVDFDETERFHTKPNDNDSDGDGVGDKQDIYASVFDATYGYAKHRTGRDEDRDDKPMELDPDSDGGGCTDGAEDQNANGIYEKSVLQTTETWNFKFIDDACGGLDGHLTYRQNSAGWIVQDQQWGAVATWTAINVRLKPVSGSPGLYEDDGSTFQYTGRHAMRQIAPGCEIIGESWAGSSGNFTGYGSAPATGQIDDDGRLGVHFVTGVVPEHTGGWSSICGTSQSGRAGDSHSASFEDSCLGDPVPPKPSDPPGFRTFRFACHEAGWEANGTVSLVVP